MSATAAIPTVSDPIMDRLNDQIDWYDKKSSHCQHFYKRIKLLEIIAAALIPFIAGSHIQYAAWVTGGLGVLITILEGVLQLYQYQQVWVSYRATSEAMQHEKFLYIAKAGDYAKVPDPHALLAQRIESLGSQENSKWASLVQQEQKVKAGTQP